MIEVILMFLAWSIQFFCFMIAALILYSIVKFAMVMIFKKEIKIRKKIVFFVCLLIIIGWLISLSSLALKKTSIYLLMI